MDIMIKESVASLFCYIIKMDSRDVEIERPLFCRFIQQNFESVSCEESNNLLDEVMKKEYNIDTQISMITNALHNETYTKMSLLKQLNEMIIKSNLHEENYILFDKVKEAFFPN